MWVDPFATFGPVSQATEATIYTLDLTIPAPDFLIKVKYRDVSYTSDGINDLFSCLTHLPKMSESSYYAALQLST